MYWLLICFPIVIEVIYATFTYFVVNIQVGIASLIASIWMLVIIPIYLLFVNIYYINNNEILHIKALILMLVIFAMRVGYMLIFHWLKYGAFIGDVPVEIYYWIIGIPSVIVIIGMIIFYLISLNAKT